MASYQGAYYDINDNYIETSYADSWHFERKHLFHIRCKECGCVLTIFMKRYKRTNTVSYGHCEHYHDERGHKKDCPNYRGNGDSSRTVKSDNPYTDFAFLNKEDPEPPNGPPIGPGPSGPSPKKKRHGRITETDPKYNSLYSFVNAVKNSSNLYQDGFDYRKKDKEIWIPFSNFLIRKDVYNGGQINYRYKILWDPIIDFQYIKSKGVRWPSEYIILAFKPKEDDEEIIYFLLSFSNDELRSKFKDMLVSAMKDKEKFLAIIGFWRETMIFDGKPCYICTIKNQKSFGLFKK